MDPTEDLEMGPQPPQVDAAEPAPDENCSYPHQTGDRNTADGVGLNELNAQIQIDNVTIKLGRVYLWDLTEAPDGTCTCHGRLHQDVRRFQESLGSQETEYEPMIGEAQQICVMTAVKRQPGFVDCIEAYLRRRQTPQELIESFSKQLSTKALRRPYDEEYPDSCFHANWMQFDPINEEVFAEIEDRVVRKFGSKRHLPLSGHGSRTGSKNAFKTAFSQEVDCLFTSRTILVVIDGWMPRDSTQHFVAHIASARTKSSTARCSLLRLRICQFILQKDLEILHSVDDLLYEIDFSIGDQKMREMSFWQSPLALHRAHLHSRNKLKRQVTRVIKTAILDDREEERESV